MIGSTPACPPVRPPPVCPQRSTSRPCLAALRSSAALRRLLWVAAATADPLLFAR